MTPRRPCPRRQGGFAYLAAILLLVVVASLAAAIVRLNAAQQTTANDALLVTRASQAARAGMEWMAYRLARGGNGACAAATLDLRADSGFLVGVTCAAAPASEGYDPDFPAEAAQEVLYTVVATACNAAAGCPDNNSAATPDYTERRRMATFCLLEWPASANAAAGTVRRPC